MQPYKYNFEFWNRIKEMTNYVMKILKLLKGKNTYDDEHLHDAYEHHLYQVCPPRAQQRYRAVWTEDLGHKLPQPADGCHMSGHRMVLISWLKTAEDPAKIKYQISRHSRSMWNHSRWLHPPLIELGAFPPKAEPNDIFSWSSTATCPRCQGQILLLKPHRLCTQASW